MTQPGSAVTVTSGHFGGSGLRSFVTFPHICPGEGCAIQRWLTRQKKAKVSSENRGESVLGSAAEVGTHQRANADASLTTHPASRSRTAMAFPHFTSPDSEHR